MTGEHEMSRYSKLAALLLTFLALAHVAAQEVDGDVGGPNVNYDRDDLKLVALEALMSAPSDKALPIVIKLLDSDESDEIKEHALFILSQINRPEAHAKLMEIARSGDGETRLEAIRMIGIGGNDEALAGLAAMYGSGDADVREAVLEAYLIAGDEDAVYELAASATTDEEFEDAVDILGAMGARDALRKLRDRGGASEELIDALAVSGDYEALAEMAMDGSDVERQAMAIEALGIVGGARVDDLLVEIYRGSNSAKVKEAALDGMLVAGHDEGVLQLYRESTDIREKGELLETLSVMGSDLLFEVIDAALQGDQ